MVEDIAEDAESRPDLASYLKSLGPGGRVMAWNSKSSSDYVPLEVKVDGKSGKLMTTDKAVLFQFDDGFDGITVTSVQAVTAVKDGVVVAYMDDSTVRSAKVSPFEEAAVFYLVGSHDKAELESAWARTFERAIADLEAKLKAMDSDVEVVWKADESGKIGFWLRALRWLGERMFGSTDESKWPEKFRAQWKYVEYIWRVTYNISGFEPVSELSAKNVGREGFVYNGYAIVNALPVDIEPIFSEKGSVGREVVKESLSHRISEVVATRWVSGEPGDIQPCFYMKNAKGQLIITDINGKRVDDKSAATMYAEMVRDASVM